MPPYADNSNLDYVPQFLASSGLQSTSSTVLPNRPWLMLAQSHPFLGSPSTPSPLMQSPSGLSPLSVNCHTSVSPLIINPPSNEAVLSNTPSKGALKAYPSPNPQQKNSSRWMLSSPITPSSMLQNNSVNVNNIMPGSSVNMESGVPLPDTKPWKVIITSLDAKNASS